MNQGQLHVNYIMSKHNLSPSRYKNERGYFADKLLKKHSSSYLFPRFIEQQLFSSKCKKYKYGKRSSVYPKNRKSNQAKFDYIYVQILNNKSYQLTYYHYHLHEPLTWSLRFKVYFFPLARGVRVGVRAARVIKRKQARSGAMTPCEKRARWHSDGQISVITANGTGAAPWSRVVETEPPFFILYLSYLTILCWMHLRFRLCLFTN
jgi:hypothetical protein